MIIDAHCHIGPKEEEFSIRNLLTKMDDSNVDKAIVCPLDRYIAAFNREGNEYILEAVEGCPERLIGFASINPWFGKKAVEELRRAIESGLSGLKLNPFRQGFHLSDPLAYPLIETCGELGVPVYFHTGTPISAMPHQLANLARRFPNVNFLMGHSGHTDLVRDAISAALRSENIFLETSFVYVAIINQALEKIGSERIIFGSDMPRSDLVMELAKFKDVEMTDRARKRIFSGNIMRILQGGRLDG
jgi:predicted TIM-barrel fold metal-dependent hydrolase